MVKVNPIDILKKEHDTVLKILSELEKDLENNNLNSLEKNIKFLEKEFDKHSLNKEEKVLFPEIEKFIPREGGPTGVMIIEHQEIVKSISSAIDGIKEKNFNKVKESVNNIISVLQPHIDKENNILFMMAETHLDDEQKASILNEFEKIDKSVT